MDSKYVTLCILLALMVIILGSGAYMTQGSELHECETARADIQEQFRNVFEGIR